MERDNQVMPILQANMNFNSHAHVERDQYEVSAIDIDEISTHTLTWSVTHIKINEDYNVVVFQLTRSRGA